MPLQCMHAWIQTAWQQSRCRCSARLLGPGRCSTLRQLLQLHSFRQRGHPQPATSDTCGPVETAVPGERQVETTLEDRTFKKLLCLEG